MTEPGPADDAAIPDDAPFEALQRELDGIVESLEQGDVPVDQAIRLWQRGEALYRACAARLDAAELKVEELTRADEAPRDTDSPGL